MRVIKIVGTSYSGSCTKTRTTCRAIVLKGDKMLISYISDLGVLLTPGGGLEPGETEEHCVVREVMEETGYIIKPAECQVEIDEYYEDFRRISKYYPGTVVGETEPHMTDWEKEVHMEPVWFPVKDVLSYYAEGISKSEDELQRSFFVKEYSAVREILGEI